MPTRIALTGFMHGSQKFKRNEAVTFDTVTIDKLVAAGLVGKEDRPDLAPAAVEELGNETPPPTPTKPAKAAKPGKKPSASPAAPASLPPTLPPLQPGVPPPLPDAK